MATCVYVCMRIYIYIYIHTYTCMYSILYTHMYNSQSFLYCYLLDIIQQALFSARGPANPWHCHDEHRSEAGEIASLIIITASRKGKNRVFLTRCVGRGLRLRIYPAFNIVCSEVPFEDTFQSKLSQIVSRECIKHQRGDGDLHTHRH